MFGFGNPKTKDPQASINRASNVVNKGILGKFTSAFMGKDFVDSANAGLASAQKAIDDNQNRAALMQTGTDAKARVENISDTGQLINLNPVVNLTLTVMPEDGEEYTVFLETMVSKIAIPRKGDEINVKIDPNDKKKVAII